MSSLRFKELESGNTAVQLTVARDTPLSSSFIHPGCPVCLENDETIIDPRQKHLPLWKEPSEEGLRLEGRFQWQMQSPGSQEIPAVSQHCFLAQTVEYV